MIDRKNLTTGQPIVVDRVAIREELHATRAAVQALLNSFDEGRWHQQSAASDWTVGEIMAHLAWSVEQLPKEIASAKQGKGMFNMPKWFADPLSYWYTRWMARNATPESIGFRFDAAITTVLHTLDDVKENEWALGAHFYGHGFYTIADLFHTPAEHFAEHTAGW